MQIVTVNLPIPHVDALATLTSKGLYPSRSEAIRVALRGFLKKELEMVEMLLHLDEKEKEITPLPVLITTTDMRRGLNDRQIAQINANLEHELLLIQKEKNR